MNQMVTVEVEDDQPVTAEEIREYRSIRPVLLQIVAEWPILRGPEGCPAMNHILAEK